MSNIQLMAIQDKKTLRFFMPGIFLWGGSGHSLTEIWELKIGQTSVYIT